jgi:hypothetical protein
MALILMTYVITNHCINFVRKIERLYVISFSFIVVAMHIKCIAVTGDDGHHALQHNSVPRCSLGWQFHLNKDMCWLVIVECVLKFQGSVTARGRSQ